MKIIDKIKILVAGVAIALAGINVAPVMATQVICPAHTNRAGKPAGNYNECEDTANNGLIDVLKTIINVIIGVVGFVTVAMIVLGGIQYTTSAGESGKVKKAKDTIMYGIIGLVVSILAFAIVNFVMSSIFTQS